MLSETVVVFLICLCGGDSDDTGHSVRTLVTLETIVSVLVYVLNCVSICIGECMYCIDVC